MSWTKGEIILEAFSEMGIASYAFDVSPEETSAALRRLDAMMAEWNARGLRLSYPIPNTADGSSVDEDSGVPDYALEAIITNLAIKLAPSYGKILSQETKTAARKSLNVLYGLSAKPLEQQFNSMPAGAGYKNSDRRFTSAPIDPLAVGDDSELDLQGALYDGSND